MLSDFSHFAVCKNKNLIKSRLLLLAGEVLSFFEKNAFIKKNVKSQKERALYKTNDSFFGTLVLALYRCCDFFQNACFKENKNMAV